MRMGAYMNTQSHIYTWYIYAHICCKAALNISHEQLPFYRSYLIALFVDIVYSKYLFCIIIIIYSRPSCCNVWKTLQSKKNYSKSL